MVLVWVCAMDMLEYSKSLLSLAHAVYRQPSCPANSSAMHCGAFFRFYSAQQVSCPAVFGLCLTRFSYAMSVNMCTLAIGKFVCPMHVHMA